MNDADNTDNIDHNDNYARRTNHDYIGSFGIIPNEPKSLDLKITNKYTILLAETLSVKDYSQSKSF